MRVALPGNPSYLIKFSFVKKRLKKKKEKKRNVSAFTSESGPQAFYQTE